MFSFCGPAFLHRFVPLVQSTIHVSLHFGKRCVNVPLHQAVYRGMPKRKSLSQQTSTTQPSEKVAKLSDLCQSSEVKAVTSPRVDCLIRQALSQPGFRMATGTSQHEPVGCEEGKQHSKADFSVGVDGDTHISSELAEAEGSLGQTSHHAGRAQRGKKTTAKGRGERVEQGSTQRAQGEQLDQGPRSSYSQFVRRQRRVNYRTPVMREDTDDSVRSTDDPSSAGISDAGNGTRRKNYNVGGSKPGQRTMTFSRKQAAVKSYMSESRTAPGDSTDSITEAGSKDAERRRRRRKKKPMPFGQLHPESSETKPEVDLLEDAVTPTSASAQGINQRESISSDEVGSSSKKNFLLGTPKPRIQTSARPRPRRSSNKRLLQMLKKSSHDPEFQGNEGEDPSTTAVDCSPSSLEAREPKAGMPKSDGVPADRLLPSPGRARRGPASSEQTRQRSVTFYRKQSGQNLSEQAASRDPNPKQTSSDAAEKLKPTSKRRVRKKNRQPAEKLESGFLPGQNEPVVPTSGRETSDALQQHEGGEAQSDLNTSVVVLEGGQIKVSEKLREDAFDSKVETKPQKHSLLRKKRHAKSKKTSTLADEAQKKRELANLASGVRGKIAAPGSEDERNLNQGGSMDAEAQSALPGDSSSVDSPGAATTDDGGFIPPTDAQKLKRSRRGKRKLLPALASGSSAMSKSIGTEETVEDAADAQPSEIIPKKKKGGTPDKATGEDASLNKSAKGKDGKKTLRKPRAKILPDSLLAQVTAFVKKDPALAKKLGELSIAEQVRRKTESMLSGRKHRSSESDCPPEDSKKAKLSSATAVDEDGVPLSVEDSSSSESTKAAAATAGADDVLRIICDVPLVLEKDNEESNTSVKKAKKKKKKKKKKKAKQSETVEGEEEPDDKDKKKKEKPQRLAPNYFVAIQVNDPEIHEELLKVQKHMVLRNLGLMPALIPLPTLHLTFSVLHLGSQEDIDKAKSALDACCRELQEQFPTDPLQFHVSGMDHFRNQVVFAKVKDGQGLEVLKNIAALVEKVLVDEGFPCRDRSGFKAHITLLKMSKAYVQLRKKGIKSIAPEVYSDYLQSDFGVQFAHKLQLCSMQKQKTKDGYYHIEHEVEFAPQTGEATQLQQFCRGLVRQSVTAALEQLREEQGLTLEAEKEAEMLQLSKAIVALSIQGAVAKLKMEQKGDKGKQRKNKKEPDAKVKTDSAEPQEKAGNESQEEEEKSESAGDVAIDSSRGAPAATLESVGGNPEAEDSKGGDANAREEKTGDEKTGDEKEAEGEINDAEAGKAEAAEVENVVDGEKGAGETGGLEERAVVVEGERVGGAVLDGGDGGVEAGETGGLEERAVVVEVEGERAGGAAVDGGDGERGAGEAGVGQEGEPGAEAEQDGAGEVEGGEAGGGGVPDAELDAFCKKLVQECVAEALQHFKEDNADAGSENDEGTSV